MVTYRLDPLLTAQGVQIAALAVVDVSAAAFLGGAAIVGGKAPRAILICGPDGKIRVYDVTGAPLTDAALDAQYPGASAQFAARCATPD